MPEIFEVALLGKAPDRSAAATELLRLPMVVAGEEVGADDDDDDDEGGAAPAVTTPMFFTSTLLPRHRGRQLMPAVGWPGWDSIQTQLFAEHKNGTGDLIAGTRGLHWCPPLSMPPKPYFWLAMRLSDAIVSIISS